MTVDLDTPQVEVHPAKIQTAEDARVAYLREEISEKDLERILARFGQQKEESTLFPHARTVERLDESFRRTLPVEDVVEPTPVEEKIKAVNQKEKERQRASRKKAPTVSIPAQEIKATP